MKLYYKLNRVQKLAADEMCKRHNEKAMESK